MQNGTGIILKLPLFDAMRLVESFCQITTTGSFIYEKVMHFLKVLMILKIACRFQKKL